MIYNWFGKTGMKVSRVGLGAFLLGKAEIEEERVGRVIDEAIEHGINLIDTADSYFDSEARVGRALAANGRREQVFLCTKLYNVHGRGGKLARNCRTNILRGIEESLRKLQTDHVDVYLLHHPDSAAGLEETMRGLEDIVQAGKTRHVGASNHYAWQVAEAMRVCERLGLGGFSVVQNCYNVMWRTAELEFIPFVRRHGLRLMAYSPLGLGLATGDFELWSRGQVGKEAAAHLHGEEGRRKFDAMRGGLTEVARELNVSLSQLAILWLLRKEAVSVALLGASGVGQISEIAGVVDGGIPREIVERIDVLTQGAVYLPYRNQPEVEGGR